MSAVPLHPTNPPPLDATTVARAFEVLLPAHRACVLFHNPHLFGDEPMPIDDYVRLIGPGVAAGFVSPVEAQRAFVTGQLWTCEFKNAEGALKLICAATLPAIAQWLQDQGLAFGS